MCIIFHLSPVHQRDQSTVHHHPIAIASPSVKLGRAILTPSFSLLSFLCVIQMVESPDDPSLSKSTVHASYPPSRAGEQRLATSLKPPSTRRNDNDRISSRRPGSGSGIAMQEVSRTATTSVDNVHANISSTLHSATFPPHTNSHQEAPASIEPEVPTQSPNLPIRLYATIKQVLFASWINLLLVFVPVGIAVQAAGVDKTIVFAMNAIAIIPLAGLLSHATESVACEMGDTIGALMNITFGNAVELIIL